MIVSQRTFDLCLLVTVTFDCREEAVGLGQSDSTANHGIGEALGRSGEILEDEYGIAVIPERFTDIVTGVDPSKFAQGSGRIGDEVVRRGFGFGADGKPVPSSATGGRSTPGISSTLVSAWLRYDCRVADHISFLTQIISSSGRSKY